MLKGTFDLIHSSGYNKGITKSKEVAIDFCKWMGKTYYYFNSEKNKWVDLEEKSELTDDDLFDMYLNDTNS